MLARCRGAFFLLFLPILALTTGCRNKTDLVEMELRTKENLYRECLEDQQRSEGRIRALQMELEALRKGAKITPEQAAATFGIKRIVLGRSTGGVDNDGLPGDELLQVVVEPRDQDDHSIKAPGTLQIVALEISPQGTKTPISNWDISSDQLRQSWKQGLLSTGYSLTLPWKQFPAYEQVRVVVRFITPDMRTYEADKDIKVRVVPGAPQKRMEEVFEGAPMPGPVPALEPTTPVQQPPQNGPILLPTGQVAPRPHVSQWRPVEPEPERRIKIGQPQPLNP